MLSFRGLNIIKSVAVFAVTSVLGYLTTVDADTKNVALSVPFSSTGKRPVEIMESNIFWNIAGTKRYTDASLACWYDEKLLHFALSKKIKKRNSGPPGKRDTNLWNGFEIFIKPKNSKESYYHIAVDLNGTIYDSKNFENLGMVRKIDPSWNMSGESITTEMRDGRWYLELTIPFATLNCPPPAQGEMWRFNVTYPQRQWSPTYSWNHVPREFGYLYFSPSSPLVRSLEFSELKENGGEVSLSVFTDHPDNMKLEINATKKEGVENFKFTFLRQLAKGVNILTAPLRLPVPGDFSIDIKCEEVNGAEFYSSIGIPMKIKPFEEKRAEYIRGLTACLKKRRQAGLNVEKVLKTLKMVSAATAWKELSALIPEASFWTNLSNSSKGIGYAVVGSCEKVLRSEILPASDFFSTARLSAAGGETRGFQIVIFSDTTLKNVRVEVDQFKDADGSATPKLEVGAVRYLRTPPSVYHSKPDISYPDPIEPIESSDLLAEVPNLFYVSASVLRKTHAGLHSTRIRFIKNGNTILSVPVSVRIFGFDIPETPTIASSIWFYRDHIRKIYNLKKPFSFEDSKAYFDFFRRHRLSLMDYPETKDGSTRKYYPLVLMENAAGGIEVDEKRISKLFSLRPYVALNTRFTKRCVSKKGGVRELTKSERMKGAKSLSAFIKSKNLTNRFYALIGDEPTPSTYSKVVRSGEKIRGMFPSCPRLCTTAPVQELAGVVDIWCPLLRDFSPEDMKKKYGTGKTFWTYTAMYCDPPFPNHYIDTAAVDQRIIFWICYKYSIKGYLNWSSNYWTGFDRRKNLHVIKNGTIDYPAWQSSIMGNLGTFNGDGYLCYPNPRSPYAEPYSSLRLENMRDGLQDYEYLKMANEINKKKNDPAIERLLELDFIKSPGEFLRDPSEMENRRIRLGEFIEQNRPKNKQWKKATKTFK